MYVIAMDLQGDMKTSEQFAKQLSQLALSGDSNVAFIIGGSLGLSDEVKKRANYKLCFSKMTFPHQLFKLIFERICFPSLSLISSISRSDALSGVFSSGTSIIVSLQ